MTAFLISALVGLVLGLAGALWGISKSRQSRDRNTQALIEARMATKAEQKADQTAHEEAQIETAEMLQDRPDDLAADVDHLLDLRSKRAH
jgi:uncharacterized protein HemX